MLQTQDFYSEIKEMTQILLKFLRKNLADGASGGGSAPSTESGLKYF